MTDCSENGRRCGSWSKRSEDEWFCLKCRREPWRPGAISIFIVKVLSWNMVGDLIVSQTSMLTAWEWKSGVNGAHGLFKPGKLCCPVKHKNQRERRMDGNCWRASRWTAVGMYGFDGADGCDGVAVPSGEGIKVADILGFQDNWKNPILQMMTTPREADGSRSL